MALLQPNGKLSPPSSTTHQLKVTLDDVFPDVWRRIQVPSDISLFRLHEVLQRAMPWTDCHLHHFLVGKRRYGPADPTPGMEVWSDRTVTLAEIAPKQHRRFTYVYGAHNSWEHEIVVEKVVRRDLADHDAMCLAGERACPPENCGGWLGYDSMLEAIEDPKHFDHDEMVAWLGRSFDPEAFDLAKANEALAGLRRPRRRP